MVNIYHAVIDDDLYTVGRIPGTETFSAFHFSKKRNKWRRLRGLICDEYDNLHDAEQDLCGCTEELGLVVAGYYDVDMNNYHLL